MWITPDFDDLPSSNQSSQSEHEEKSFSLSQNRKRKLDNQSRQKVIWLISNEYGFY